MYASPFSFSFVSHTKTLFGASTAGNQRHSQPKTGEMLPRKLAIGLRTLLVASIVSVALAQPCEQWTASENEEWRTLHYDYGVDQSARKTVLQPLLDQPLADILHIEDKQLCDAQQLLGLENLEGRWYRVADSDVVYEPASCRLRRLSAGAARQCLEGKFVAFIGDSVTRYGGF